MWQLTLAAHSRHFAEHRGTMWSNKHSLCGWKCPMYREALRVIVKLQENRAGEEAVFINTSPWDSRFFLYLGKTRLPTCLSLIIGLSAAPLVCLKISTHTVRMPLLLLREWTCRLVDILKKIVFSVSIMQLWHYSAAFVRGDRKSGVESHLLDNGLLLPLLTRRPGRKCKII